MVLENQSLSFCLSISAGYGYRSSRTYIRRKEEEEEEEKEVDEKGGEENYKQRESWIKGKKMKTFKERSKWRAQE